MIYETDKQMNYSKNENYHQAVDYLQYLLMKRKSKTVT